MIDLKIFEYTDTEINAVYNYINDEYSLEIGEDIIYETDLMDDKEVIEWAVDCGYLEEEEGYLDEDGTPNMESFRELKKTNEEEYPPTYATPSGRAFLFFEGIDFPERININLIDGLHPGNDWQGVIIKECWNLIELQRFLYENGSKVNFIIQ